MKRTVTLLLMALTACAAFAQQLGVEANFYSMMERYRYGSSSKLRHHDPMNGVRVGLVYEYDFNKWFGLSTGLKYTYQGRSSTDKNPVSGIATEQHISRRAHFMEVPVLANLRVPMAKQTYFIVYAGPQFSYALSYKAKTEVTTYGGGTTTSTLNLIGDDVVKFYGSNYDDNVKPFNVQLSLGVAFQYERYQLRAGYDFGMMNLYKTTYYPEYSVRTFNRRDTWGIGLVYFFK